MSPPFIPDLPTGTHDRHVAAISVRANGSKAALMVDVGSTGILAIGALVAMTLLSTAVLVHVATRRPT